MGKYGRIVRHTGFLRAAGRSGVLRRVKEGGKKVKAKEWKRVGACLLGCLLMFPMGNMRADAAENTVNVQVDVEFGQAEAQTVKDMVNDLRTGNDAWQYKSDGSIETITGLQGLVYDEKLEEIAMQRAAEIALYYSHTRVNGKDCFTAYNELGYSGTVKGENIAAGQRSAQEVFAAWCEDGPNDTYETQGHRRNMLSKDFTAIGMGHVVYNGIHYWAMELGNSGTESNTGVDGAQTVQVEVQHSHITSLSAGKASCAVAIGGVSELPEITVTLAPSVEWASEASCKAVNPDWVVGDTSVATVADGKVTGLKAGSTTLTATAGGASTEITLEVTADGQGSDDNNTGDDNTGDNNTGDDNIGDNNTGDDNTGDDNTGDDNNGDDNTGNGDNNNNSNNNGGSNSNNSGSKDDGKEETSSGSSAGKDAPAVMIMPTTSMVGGVKTATEGIYLANSVNGSIITTSVADIANGYGLTNKEKPYNKIYNLDPKKSSLAKASVDAAAAEQKAVVGPILNIELGKMNGGNYTLLPSDGPAIRIVLGIPENFAQSGKTYAVVCVRAGGAYTVLKDLDSVSDTITFDTTGGAGVYAIIKY